MATEEIDSSDDRILWRNSTVAIVRGDDIVEATDALLALTFDELDQTWIENVLMELIDGSYDWQVRALAVICLGHVARIHGVVSPNVSRKLRDLLNDSLLASRAQNALDDIEVFVHELK